MDSTIRVEKMLCYFIFIKRYYSTRYLPACAKYSNDSAKKCTSKYTSSFCVIEKQMISTNNIHQSSGTQKYAGVL